MKTKVIFKESDFDNQWMVNDEGYIDGYVSDRYGEAFACVVTNYTVVKAPLKALRIMEQMR